MSEAKTERHLPGLQANNSPAKPEEPGNAWHIPRLARAARALNRRWIAWGIVLVLYTLLCFWAFRGAVSMQSVYPSVSLRYTNSISATTAQNAQHYAAKSKTETIWPTYWAQQNKKVTIHQSNAQAQADCLFFYGDAAKVWPTNFLAGTYPGQLEEKGCAVSRQLAWQLFGSTDVLGLTVTINETDYTIRGVFEGDDPLLLASCPEGPAGGWQNVELDGFDSSKDIREQALQFASSSGLGTPQHLVNGGSVVSVMQLLASLPILILLIAGFIGILRRQKQMGALRRNILLFGVLFALALLLPWMLAKLPPWLLPTRWSDFSFWGGVAKQIGQRLQEWWLLPPFLKDAQAKGIVLRQILLVFGQLFLLPIFWYLAKTGKSTKVHTP